MSYLLLLLLLPTLSLLLLPTLFHLLLTRILSFSIATLKLKHPFKYTSMHLEIEGLSWGVRKLVVFVPEIRVGLDVRRGKLRVVVERPRVMVVRNGGKFVGVRVVQGVKEEALLYNMMEILKGWLQGQSTEAQQSQPAATTAPAHNRLLLLLHTVVQSSLLILSQFLQLQIQALQSTIVPPLPTPPSPPGPTHKSLTFHQCFAQYLLYIDTLLLKPSIHQNHQLLIQLSLNILKLYTAEHMQNNLITMQGAKVGVMVPMSMSVGQSLRRVGVRVDVPGLVVYCTPGELEGLAQLVNQLMFEPAKVLAKDGRSATVATNQDQQNNTGKFILQVHTAQLHMTQLCQPHHDTLQALKHLSNISRTSLSFHSISVTPDLITIPSCRLTLLKYHHPTPTQILHLPNLTITKQSHLVSVTHDDVSLHCEREQLALLGKLFALINNRILGMDEYKEEVYAPYVDIVGMFLEGKCTLGEIVGEMVVRRGQGVEQEDGDGGEGRESGVVYRPGNVELSLKIADLEHRIVLGSTCYTQSRNTTGEIDHELKFGRIVVEYRGIKQFNVMGFVLFYKQYEGTNELEIQLGDLQMVQNEHTLKQYLIAFTMFKMLLQFNTDDQEQQGKKMKVTAKKKLVFEKIVLNYASELLILRKLSIEKQASHDGKLSSLYFCLGKCELSVEKLLQTNKMFKYQLNPSHALLQIASITIKQNIFLDPLTQQPKQKYMVHVKNPTFLLPQVDISDRLLNYIRTFNKLEPNIEAFLKNTTNQKISTNHRKYKNFMVDTNIFAIKVTGLMIGIQDNYLDRAMLSKHKFMRQYMQREVKYSENQIINNLKQTKISNKLLQITVQCISVEVKPLESVGDNEKTVNEWIYELRDKYRKQKESNQDQDTVRLIRANNFHIRVQLTKLQTKIRDYSFNIANISKIEAKFQYLKTKNIYEETFHYLLAESKIKQIQLQVGLNLLSGLSQIHSKLSRYSRAIDQYKNTDQFLSTLKSRQSIQHTKYKPYWHIMHRSMDWHICIDKQSKIKIRLLTGITPYTEQSVDLVLGAFNVVSTPMLTRLSIQSVNLYGNKLSILECGQQVVEINSTYLQPYLKLQVKYLVKPEQQPQRNLLRISAQIVQELFKIKQLRTDWLLVYGLVEPSSRRHSSPYRREQQANYVDLLRIAANKSLQNSHKTLTIFSVLKFFHFSLHIDRFCLQVTDGLKCINFIVNQVQIRANAYAKMMAWRMMHFGCGYRSLVGTTNQQSKVVEELKNIDGGNNKKMEEWISKDLFFISREFMLTLNQIHMLDGKYFEILKKINIKTIKIQLNKQLKKLLDTLYKSIFSTHTETIKSLQSTTKHFKTNPLVRLRAIVMQVIRSNRKKKNFFPRLRLHLEITNFELGFNSASRLLLLSTSKPSLLTMTTVFNEADVYHIDPRYMLKGSLADVEIWVSAQTANSWLLQQGYSAVHVANADRILNCAHIALNLQKNDNNFLPQQYLQRLLTCKTIHHTILDVTCSSGSIELTHQNLQVLQQIMQIIVSLADSKEQRRRQMAVEKDKYAEMVMHGRQVIKNKLQWQYTDMSKTGNQRVETQIRIGLDSVDIVLCTGGKTINQGKQVYNTKQNSSSRSSQAQTSKSPFLKLLSSNISTSLTLYTSTRMDKHLQVSNLTMVNLLQPHDSPYHLLLQMNHDQSLAIDLHQQHYLLPATQPTILWSFSPLLAIHLNPIKIHFTQQLYSHLYYFFFSTQPTPDSPSSDNDQPITSILPDYYHSISIDECKVQVWYRTGSVWKRLEGVNVGLGRYEQQAVFGSGKAVFDGWVGWVLRQLAGQFFSVVGQKIFG